MERLKHEHDVYVCKGCRAVRFAPMIGDWHWHSRGDGKCFGRVIRYVPVQLWRPLLNA